MDSTTSGSGVHPTRVKTALLAEESQHMRQTRGTQSNNLPMSSEPPIHHANHLYGPTRHQRRRGRLKVKAKNISQAQNGQTTYWIRARAAQPCVNAPRRRYGVHRPRRQCGRIKTVPENINPAQEVEKTYWVRASIAQPCGNALKHCWEVHRPKRRCGRIKIASRNVNRTRNGRRTYLGRVNAIQSTWRPKKGIKRFNKLTFGFRMLGEYWRKVEDYG